MDFERYYRTLFRDDLQRVLEGLESPHRDPDITAIQPRTLSSLNPVIRGWNRERQIAFASGLYLTILADEVCWTHFHGHYEKFRRLTQYPKLLGDCPGGCTDHLEPYVVFQVIGKRPGPGPHSFDSEGGIAFPDGFVPGMQREIADFCETHMPELEQAGFWTYCGREIHLLQSLARPRERPAGDHGQRVHHAPRAIAAERPQADLFGDMPVESYTDGRWGGLPVTTHEGHLNRLRELVPAFERRPFRIADDNGAPSPANRALETIVRSDTKVPVGVVSTGYQLVRHQDLFDEILRALNGLGLEGAAAGGGHFR